MEEKQKSSLTKNERMLKFVKELEKFMNENKVNPEEMLILGERIKLPSSAEFYFSDERMIDLYGKLKAILKEDNLTTEEVIIFGASLSHQSSHILEAEVMMQFQNLRRGEAIERSTA